MRRGFGLPPLEGIDPIELSQTVEELGYSSIWVPELWGSDAFVQLAMVATATESVQLGTSIVNVFSRSPAVLAMATATLDRYANGRIILGTGVSTETAIEDLHGLPYERPIRRAHETIEIVGRYLSDSDERVGYDGEIFQVEDVPPLDCDVPIYHAALGSANRRVVARLADGWIPNNIPFPDLEDTFSEIANVAKQAGRDPDDITVAPFVPAAVDEDTDRARDAIRGHVAYYVGSGEGYRRAVANRFPDEAETIADYWQQGNRSAAIQAVTDEMVGALSVAGTPEEAQDRLDELEDGIIDMPIIVLPPQAAAEFALPTIEALAPEP